MYLFLTFGKAIGKDSLIFLLYFLSLYTMIPSESILLLKIVLIYSFILSNFSEIHNELHLLLQCFFSFQTKLSTKSLVIN